MKPYWGDEQHYRIAIHTICDTCGGSGEIVITEDYASKAEAQADYPKAMRWVIVDRK